MLLDSNVIIYLRDPEFVDQIVAQFGQDRLYTCNIVIAEVLGFHSLSAADSKYFEQFFASCTNLALDTLVTKETINIRRQLAIGLPDAIIAGTALAHNIPVWSRNSTDFRKIPGLQWFNPIK